MAGQSRRDVLICIGDGGSTDAFATVAGMRAQTISAGSVIKRQWDVAGPAAAYGATQMAAD